MLALRTAPLRAVRLAPSPADTFEEHSRYVAGLAFRLLGRDEEVDDLVQDVFLEAVRGLETLKEAGAVRGWLATLTVRLAGRRIRRRRIASFFGFGDDGPDEQVVSLEASPEQRVLLSQVYRVLEKIPVDQRLAWTLRYIEGEQLEAVAELCGCSLATAKRRIAAAQAVIEGAFHED
jgi:RNA polymerase sigma-70 factor (ECF subfamily)